MPIKAVTIALRDLLLDALHEASGLAANPYTVFVGPPDVKNDTDELILFLLRITPDPELRNAERIRPFPKPTDPLRRLEPAVPLELHYLVTGGSPHNTTAPDALSRLGYAIRAIEGASPLVVPQLPDDPVWLSLEPLSTEELSRIWGMFPNFNCRTCFTFRASPVWIDPRVPRPGGGPVISDSIDYLQLAGS